MRIRLLALAATLALQPALAASPQPSEKSVLQLLQLMHTHQIMDNTGAQMDDTLQRSMKAATAQMQLSPEQEKIRDQYRAKIVAIVRDALNWSTVEPMLVQAYQSTFTQEEVNAMLRFYDSPVGQSVGAKLPAVNQQMAQLTQQRMQEIIPKIVEVQKDMAEHLRAASSGAAAQTPSPQPSAH
ncbi:MAG TPA: DUF2059 domain-containing protein [Steroidobacteraceae bacterium]|nr:DUF2059 domain-containing protein [Steroidobacteraceae bacterium]